MNFRRLMTGSLAVAVATSVSPSSSMATRVSRYRRRWCLKSFTTMPYNGCRESKGDSVAFGK